MFRLALLAVALASAAGAFAADLVGTITILEGDAIVYRGASRVQAQEALRMNSGDLVETGAKTFMQIEMPDQSRVELGPATRMQFIAPSPRGKSERWLYFLEGWGKVTNAKTESALDIRAPLFEVPGQPGVIVFETRPNEVTLFVERGDARLVERAPAASPAPVALKTGDYYRRKSGTRGTVNSSEARAMVEKLPRAFRDTLPSRLEKLRGREVKPREAPAFAYADVEGWLKAEPAVRRQFVQRWRPKARESAFRSALIANLSAHPEWDPILFPEKYLPKEPQESKATPGSTPAPVTR